MRIEADVGVERISSEFGDEGYSEIGEISSEFEDSDSDETHANSADRNSPY